MAAVCLFAGRPAIQGELQALIGRMAVENRLWGQKRIQAELARLGFQVSARTVAKYMRGCRPRGPTGTWREFLTRHASSMWACDFVCVPTVLFQTLHVFFVIRLANREIFHVAVTRYPTADWAAQQIVECCAWDRAPPRFLIHDRDSRYGANFDRRVRGASEYAKFGRRSGHPEPMPSLRDGCDLRDRNVWTISLFSAKLICVEFYPRTSPITIVGDRTVRWAKSRHAAKQGPSLGEHAQRSPPNLCSVGYTTFTALLHDKFLRPTGEE